MNIPIGHYKNLEVFKVVEKPTLLVRSSKGKLKALSIPDRSKLYSIKDLLVLEGDQR